MSIKLSSPVIANIPVNPSTTAVAFSELKLRQSVDNPTRKTVSVYFVGAPLPLVIWSGPTYDSIGNWTQEQLELEVSLLVTKDPLAILKAITGAASITDVPTPAPAATPEPTPVMPAPATT